MGKNFFLLATVSILFATLSSAWAVSEINLYFPPEWKDQPESVYKIADGLSQEVGIKISPQIVDCYPEVLTALSQKKPTLAYVGSMVQTIVISRKLGTPLLQALDNKQFYGGILVFPKGMSPSAILNDNPTEIAYTLGTTSGEICAKVATGGKASIAVLDQRGAVDSMRSGKAKAAFVKNTWWEENRTKYPAFDSYSVPGVSRLDNADNVLLASNFVSTEIRSLITTVAIKKPHIFNADLVVPVDSFLLWFTMELMHKAGINPLTYSWPDSGQCIDKSDSSPLILPDPASQNDLNLLAGEVLVKKKCIRCHLLEKVKKYRRKTMEQWEGTLLRKLDMGVELTEAEKAELINYLLSLKRMKK